MIAILASLLLMLPPTSYRILANLQPMVLNPAKVYSNFPRSRNIIENAHMLIPQTKFHYEISKRPSLDEVDGEGKAIDNSKLVDFTLLPTISDKTKRKKFYEEPTEQQSSIMINKLKAGNAIFMKDKNFYTGLNKLQTSDSIESSMDKEITEQHKFSKSGLPNLKFRPLREPKPIDSKKDDPILDSELSSINNNLKEHPTPFQMSTFLPLLNSESSHNHGAGYHSSKITSLKSSGKEVRSKEIHPETIIIKTNIESFKEKIREKKEHTGSANKKLPIETISETTVSAETKLPSATTSMNSMVISETEAALHKSATSIVMESINTVPLVTVLNEVPIHMETVQELSNNDDNSTQMKNAPQTNKLINEPLQPKIVDNEINKKITTFEKYKKYLSSRQVRTGFLIGLDIIFVIIFIALSIYVYLSCKGDTSKESDEGDGQSQSEEATRKSQSSRQSEPKSDQEPSRQSKTEGSAKRESQTDQEKNKIDQKTNKEGQTPEASGLHYIWRKLQSLVIPGAETFPNLQKSLKDDDDDDSLCEVIVKKKDDSQREVSIQQDVAVTQKQRRQSSKTSSSLRHKLKSRRHRAKTADKNKLYKKVSTTIEELDDESTMSLQNFVAATAPAREADLDVHEMDIVNLQQQTLATGQRRMDQMLIKPGWNQCMSNYLNHHVEDGSIDSRAANSRRLNYRRIREERGNAFGIGTRISAIDLSEELGKKIEKEVQNCGKNTDLLQYTIK